MLVRDRGIGIGAGHIDIPGDWGVGEDSPQRARPAEPQPKCGTAILAVTDSRAGSPCHENRRGLRRNWLIAVESPRRKTWLMLCLRGLCGLGGDPVWFRLCRGKSRRAGERACATFLVPRPSRPCWGTGGTPLPQRARCPPTSTRGAPQLPTEPTVRVHAYPGGRAKPRPARFFILVNVDITVWSRGQLAARRG